MYALLNVAFALLAGLLMTRIFSRWRLPDVTAFLVAGVGGEVRAQRAAGRGGVVRGQCRAAVFPGVA